MKRVIFIIVGIAVAIVAAGALFSTLRTDEVETSTQQDTLKEYVRMRDGISFSYPNTYYLEEKTINEAQRYHYEIILTEDNETNAQIRSGEIGPTEGPVAVTVSIFQNNLDKQSLVGFVTGTNNSNYKLATGPYASTTVAGTEALSYAWDGLYNGKSVVFAHRDNIIMLSVTHNGPQDPILDVFGTVVESIKLQ